MRKFTLILIMFILFFIPFSVEAQDKVHFSLVSVDIWPEYDEPAVLMSYHITLSPDTPLPASLSLRIPSGVEINAVAIMDANGNLINAPYDNTNQGQWSLLTMSTPSYQVQVEYYTLLVKTGTTRHVVLDWAGEYAADKMVVNFLRPLGADNLIISLPVADTSPGQDGLTNYRIEATNLAADQLFKVAIDYQRQSDSLSISSLPVQAVSTPGPETPGHVSMTGIYPWVLAGSGLFLIVAGIMGFVTWQRGSQGSFTGRQNSPNRKESEEEFIYCHECGKRAQDGDVFCRTCGTRLKRGTTE